MLDCYDVIWCWLKNKIIQRHENRLDYSGFWLLLQNPLMNPNTKENF